MPNYDFRCLACKKSFSKILTLAQYDKGKVECPHCGSRKVEQKFSSFFAVTSKKSA
ncbi:MAG: zinc ribbon domain-containing protein [Acidobacteriales bacterium]|nr:zinc ribbon domain-containing protein [Terriglobales bacterium]